MEALWNRCQMMRNNEQIGDVGRADQLLVEMQTHINTLRLGQFAQSQQLRKSTKALTDVVEAFRRREAEPASSPHRGREGDGDDDEEDNDDSYDDDFEDDLSATENHPDETCVEVASLKVSVTTVNTTQEARRLMRELSEGLGRQITMMTTMNGENGEQNAWEELDRGALKAPYYRFQGKWTPHAASFFFL